MDDQDIYAIITAIARQRGALWLRDNVQAPYGVHSISDLNYQQVRAVLTALRASVLIDKFVLSWPIGGEGQEQWGSRRFGSL